MGDLIPSRNVAERDPSKEKKTLMAENVNQGTIVTSLIRLGASLMKVPTINLSSENVETIAKRRKTANGNLHKTEIQTETAFLKISPSQY